MFSFRWSFIACQRCGASVVRSSWSLNMSLTCRCRIVFERRAIPSQACLNGSSRCSDRLPANQREVECSNCQAASTKHRHRLLQLPERCARQNFIEILRQRNRLATFARLFAALCMYFACQFVCLCLLSVVTTVSIDWCFAFEHTVEFVIISVKNWSKNRMLNDLWLIKTKQTCATLAHNTATNKLATKHQHCSKTIKIHGRLQIVKAVHSRFLTTVPCNMSVMLSHDLQHRKSRTFDLKHNQTRTDECNQPLKQTSNRSQVAQQSIAEDPSW